MTRVLNLKSILLATTLALPLFTKPQIVFSQENNDPIARNGIDTIIVTTRRREQPLKDVAGSISVISSDDLEDLVVSDLNQIFKYEPGVEITGATGKAQNIIVRGMGGDRVLIVKDGIRVNEGYGADGRNDIVGRGFIETDTLKQVEVAKGGFSSLYGSDALAGIVVFVTKDASDYLETGQRFGGNLRIGHAQVSEQNNIGATLAAITGPVEHVFSATLRDGKEQENYFETTDAFEIESTSLFYKGKWNITPDESLTVTADVWEQESEGDRAEGLLYYFRGLDVYGYDIVDENIESTKTNESYKATFKTETPLALYDEASVAIYHNTAEQEDIEFGALDINAPLFSVFEMRDMWKTGVYKQETWGFLSNATKLIGQNHVLGYGLDIEETTSLRTSHEYREADGVVTRDILVHKFPENDVFRAGVFINDEMTFLNGDLIITPGARYDIYKIDPGTLLNSSGQPYREFDESHLSFNLGGLYHFNDHVTGFIQYGQGFKAPSFDLAYVEHYNQPTSSYIYQVIPSNDLDPEESSTWEIGLRGQVGPLSYNASYYQSDYRDFLTVGLVSSTTVFSGGSFSHVHDVFQYQNIDSVTIKGAEASVNYDANETLSFFANASWQTGKNDVTGEYIDTISPLSGRIGASLQGENWSTNLIMRWAADMKKVNAGDVRTPSYEVFDWNAEYQFNDHVSFNIAANNLFDEEYIRHVNIAGHASTQDLNYFTEAGRNISVSLKARF